MRAIVATAWGGPEVLALQPREEPRPAPGQVTIDVGYAGARVSALPVASQCASGPRVGCDASLGQVPQAGARTSISPGNPADARTRPFRRPSQRGEPQAAPKRSQKMNRNVKRFAALAAVSAMGVLASVASAAGLPSYTVPGRRSAAC